MKPSEIVKNHKEDIKRIILDNNGLFPRIFGSVARGEDTKESDLDIIIDSTPHLSYIDVGTMMYELQEQFGLRVDIATSRSLPEKFRQKVLDTAVAL